MSKEQINYILILCIATVFIASSIKYTFWRTAKKKGNSTRGFAAYYFKWFSVYAIWDTANEARRDFMKVNNRTNIVIWTAIMICAVILYTIVF